MILIIDNYDSFVYNLVQYIGSITTDIHVVRNDRITLDEIEAMAPSAIVISPGPGTPTDAGICIDLVKRFAPDIPLLGVCLGHQVIAAAFGARVIRADRPVHGKTSQVFHNEASIFAQLPSPIDVTRYHSLMVEAQSLPDCLHVTAKIDGGTIMAIQHSKWSVFGLQFHPESILSEFGHALIQNFVHSFVAVGHPIVSSGP